MTPDLARFIAAEADFRKAQVRAQVCLATGSQDRAERIFGQAALEVEAAREELLTDRAWMMSADINDIRRVLG